MREHNHNQKRWFLIGIAFSTATSFGLVVGILTENLIGHLLPAIGSAIGVSIVIIMKTRPKIQNDDNATK